MKFFTDNDGFIFERDNGEKVRMSHAEIGFVSHQLERNSWGYGIDMEIESNYDSLNFDSMTEAEFKKECIDDLESKWELGRLDNEPDYQCVVFDVAQENGIWRND